MIKLFPTRLQLVHLLPKESIGAEIGVHKGDLSRVLLRVVRPNRLHLIDMWDHWYAPEYQAQLDPLCQPAPAPSDTQGEPPMNADQWATVRAHLQAMFVDRPVDFHVGISWQIAGRFANDYFDWLYIDAGHRREDCLADLMAYYPKLKPDGLCLIHDFCYIFPGVMQAVLEFVQEGRARVVAIDRSEFTTIMLQKAVPC